MQRIEGKIAIVTGANRGVGKGIALGLGEAGATVYVTGRATEPGQSRSGTTIHDVAAEVTRLGGRGVAVRCDHARDEDVKAVIAQVEAEQGRLDLLVNNVIDSPDEAFASLPFWDERSIPAWDAVHRVGLRCHYVASAYAAPILIRQRQGLIVNISSWAAMTYLFGVAYGVVKSALDRMSADMAHELRPHGVAVISLWPGVVRTERILEEVQQRPEFAATFQMLAMTHESPQFTGRAVAALAADPQVMERSGRALVAAELAEEYGFTDVDGGSPTSIRSVLLQMNTAPEGGQA